MVNAIFSFGWLILVTHPEARVAGIDLPVWELVMVVKHGHVLGCLAHAVGWVVLDKAEVVGKLEATGPGAHENHTGVVGFGQKGNKVLHGRSRPRGVCCHS